jgi:predicted N-acetyltransferase YhbS
VPYVFIDGGKIVVNVSISKIKLIIKGETKEAIQIGTVMAHPNYRNQRLSASLINKVIEEFDEKVDIMYLFGNQSVLEFYPKFGFKKSDESLFTTTFTGNQNKSTGIHKLDCTNKDHLDFIYKFTPKRLPVSQIFGAADTKELFMFYSLYVFREKIYYIDQEDVIVIFENEEKQINIFDIVIKKDYCIENILNKIATNDTSVIILLLMIKI